MGKGGNQKTMKKWGQGRPYFLLGAVPFAVFTFLTFYIPNWDASGRLIWAYVTYCLLCTAYTVVNIPLNTIVPRLTSDIHERDILVSTRMVCALVGTAIVMTITEPLVRFFGQGNEAKGYLLTMTVYGIAAMFIFFLTFASTEEVVPPTISQKHSFRLTDAVFTSGSGKKIQQTKSYVFQHRFIHSRRSADLCR